MSLPDQKQVTVEPASPTNSGEAGENPSDERFKRISRSAYFRAERRGFQPNQELEDWYAAEEEDAKREERPSDKPEPSDKPGSSRPSP